MAYHRPRGGQNRNSRNQNNSNPGREFAPEEFFTLGEHTVGLKHYRFRYNGKIYRILESRAADWQRPEIPEGQPEEQEGRTEAIAEPTEEGVAVTAVVEPTEVLLLEEAEAAKAYEAWNHIKRPERFGL